MGKGVKLNDTGQHPDVSAFLASSVHDMKNSLSMLLVFLENELDDLREANSPAYGKMAQMLYQVKRVNAQLIQFLAVYKIDQKLYPFDLEENSVIEFASEVLAQNKPLLDSLGIRVELDCPPSLNWYFDRDLISGVIGNAFTNAAHYTKDRIRLAATLVDGELELRIEDNGAGYPESMLHPGSANRQGVDFGGGSTGLGLYFSTLVAQLHRNRDRIGSIRLENGGAYGGGCFLLRLP